MLARGFSLFFKTYWTIFKCLMWTASHCLPPLPQASELRWLTTGSISLNLTNQTLHSVPWLLCRTVWNSWLDLVLLPGIFTLSCCLRLGSLPAPLLALLAPVISQLSFDFGSRKPVSSCLHFLMSLIALLWIRSPSTVFFWKYRSNRFHKLFL